MLFAILIGLIDAARYTLRSGLVKLRFWLSGVKKTKLEQAKIPFIIFSDDKRYWNVFEPVCRELTKRNIPIKYMTGSADDPALKCAYKNFKAEFIGSGNKGFAKLNFLRANIVLSTTPGLDVYQWKRSKDVDFYVHILHAPTEVAAYRMFGLDYYDAILISGNFQVKQIRYLEKLRNLPNKETYHIGIPYMDEMLKRLKASMAQETRNKKQETRNKKQETRTNLHAKPDAKSRATYCSFGAFLGRKCYIFCLWWKNYRKATQNRKPYYRASSSAVFHIGKRSYGFPYGKIPALRSS